MEAATEIFAWTAIATAAGALFLAWWTDARHR